MGFLNVLIEESAFLAGQEFKNANCIGADEKLTNEEMFFLLSQNLDALLQQIFTQVLFQQTATLGFPEQFLFHCFCFMNPCLPSTGLIKLYDLIKCIALCSLFYSKLSVCLDFSLYAFCQSSRNFPSGLEYISF